MTAQKISLVMNEWAFKLLSEGGTPEPGRTVVLKAMLNLQKNRNLPSHIAFVDLIKVYFIDNHDLLFNILEQYGTLPRLSQLKKKSIKTSLLFSILRKKWYNSPKLSRCAKFV
jgi:hypothetical protein